MISLREQIESEVETYYYLSDDIYNTKTKDEIIDIMKRTDLIYKTIEPLDFYVDINGLTYELESFSTLTKDIILKYVNNFKEGIKNRCLICNTDMGRSNPRQ